VLPLKLIYPHGYELVYLYPLVVLILGIHDVNVYASDALMLLSKHVPWRSNVFSLLRRIDPS
jgi:hypothetical protein